MFRLLFLLIAFLVAAPALAQWPTTEWEVLDGPPDVIYECWGGAHCEQPSGARKKFAAKHAGMLESASRWYESLGFHAPRIKTLDGDLTVDENEPYVGYLEPQKAGDIGSATMTDGTMVLNTNPGFLVVGTPLWELMEASAVHELFHGIQNANASYREYIAGSQDEIMLIPSCRPGNANYDELGWITEGMAAAVQVRWLERTKGPWGHPFKGSGRTAWKRYFDQPLHIGSLPAEIVTGSDKKKSGWWCSYGTWYFWYAVGEFLGQTTAQKVGYMRYIIERDGPWDRDLALVDAGLRKAAAALGAIKPYSQGLYDLYPQFVAQYLDVDKFYDHLRVVDLGSTDLFEVASKGIGPPFDIPSLGAQAWRFRIHVAEQSSSHLIPVRFTLEAQADTERRDLHLIVEQRVVGRPALETTPYSYVDSISPTPGAVHEYLVRVANVAPEAEKTQPAAFELRVEVGGFYGQTPDSVDLDHVAGKVSAELPPGFVMQGPGRWSCSGDANARAIFDLLTPEEAGRDMERAVPQLFQKYGQVMGNAAIAFQKMQRQGDGQQLEKRGIDPAAMMEKMAAARNEMRAKVDDLGLDEATAAAAKQARARTMSELAATFVGVNDGEECQILLHAQLAGRHGGAQILAGAVDRANYPDGNVPKFNMRVLPADVLEARRNARQNAKQFAGVLANSGILGAKQLLQQTLRPMLGEPSRWEVCTMTAEERRDERASASENCPAVLCTPGKLVLENAEQGHITGTFSFEVVRWSEDDRHCRPLGRDEVTGHFNVTSTDDGHDDDSIGGLGIGIIYSGTFARPGMPLLDSGDAE